MNMIMNPQSVIEFLGRVALLRMLPISHLRKIAQVAYVKHFDQGDFVVREGEVTDGIYFIWEGEAEVVGSLSTDDEDCPKFHLKQHDYFSHGIASSTQMNKVISLSKLTCLILPKEHTYLLKRPLVERILHVHLDPVDVNVFQGITLPEVPNLGHVYGGQLVGQALAAACKTVDSLKIVHSLHAYFLRSCDPDIPITYQVHHLRDGKSFGTRRVEAIQKENVVFTLLASFRKEEAGFVHQVVKMPSVPDPEELLSMEELREKSLSDTYLPRTHSAEFVSWPIEIRFCEPNIFNYQTKLPPSLRLWFRAKGTLSDEQSLHRCVAAFASVLSFHRVSLNPQCEKNLKLSWISIDHSIWFHRPFRAGDWLLFVIESPNAHSSRRFVCGQFFTRKGELVASVIQEDILRKAKMPVSDVQSKL